MLFAAEDLAVGADVEAGVIADDDADIGGFFGDLEEGNGLVGNAVQDEDEVGCGMQAVAEEVAQVVARVRGVGEGV